ncbi:MAG: hydroxyacid dehydrogenase [Ruminococcaceae bacterium]|nr:hydroxyacid dehydrogenase [Oscillospiraceae bacterium]
MKVFLCESIHPKALALLESRAEVVSDWERLGEVDAIINRNLKLPREVLEKAPSLKVIAVHGTGSDGIDLEYCDEHGITILFVPFQNSDSVAELIVTLSLALLRKIYLADRLVTSGNLSANAPPELFGNELGGKTIGLVGVGDIARRMAKIMINGFGCKVIGYDPYWPTEKAAELGIRQYESLDEMLENADVINVSVHLTESTANLLNAERFSHCKPTAVLINASRGGVVDEAALYTALTTGQLGAAACDVFVSEPPTKENPLVGLPNMLCTPHLGANTDEALERVGMRMVQDIFLTLDGGKPEFVYSLHGVRTN